MTSKDLHEEITAFVAERMDEREYRAKVEQSVPACPDCRASFEREVAARMKFRDRAEDSAAAAASRAALPGDNGSGSTQRRESAGHSTHRPAKPTWLDTFHTYYLSPFGVAVALLLLAGCGYLLYKSRTAPGPLNTVAGAAPATVNGVPAAPENFFNRAAKNFEAMMAGQLGVEVKTDDVDELREHFKAGGVAYPVLFEPVKGELAGGFVTHHGPQSFAHLLYQKGESYLYLFEVPNAALIAGDIVYVTPDVLKRLEAGEVIWEDQPGGPLVMYKKGDVVIAALSNASRPAMAQMLPTK